MTTTNDFKAITDKVVRVAYDLEESLQHGTYDYVKMEDTDRELAFHEERLLDLYQALKALEFYLKEDETATAADWCRINVVKNNIQTLRKIIDRRLSEKIDANSAFIVIAPVVGAIISFHDLIK